MRSLLLIILFLATYLVNGQPSCSTTGLGGDIFYPNTISTPTSATNGNQYLCGPNTVVYDTIPIGCLFVHLNTGSTLFYNKGCPQLNVNTVWLKNNSTLNILANCPPMSLTVYYEPLAIINNPAAVSIGSVACTSITFPTVCATGIKESEKENMISVYPMPTSNILNISINKNGLKKLNIEIINSIGQTVLKTEFKNQIDVSELTSGFYTLLLKDNSGSMITKKFVKE